MKVDSILHIMAGTAFVLLVPLLAMFFTDEIQWNLSDFVAAGTLLVGAGFVYELLASKVSARRRAVVAVVLITTILLVWVELAVGIFGSPFAGS